MPLQIRRWYVVFSAATICENANYNSDNFNAEILANNKDSNGNNSA